jgi:hypothetical protein
MVQTSATHQLPNLCLPGLLLLLLVAVQLSAPLDPLLPATWPAAAAASECMLGLGTSLLHTLLHIRCACLAALLLLLLLTEC